MAAVGVVMGAVKEARLLLISEYGHILDVVFQTMHFYPSEAQLLQYACALLALLIVEGERERMREGENTEIELRFCSFSCSWSSN